MKKDIKVSVIVPVYNTSEYLEECISSILEQNLKLEVIIIDDQSTDRSYELANNLYKNNKNIKIVRNKLNSGQGFCRNIGINKSKGEYIFFVDSDDFLPKNSLSKLYNHAKNNKLDITIGWIKSFNSKRSFTNELFFSKNINKTDIHESPWLLKNISPCNKLYKRQFIYSNKGLRFIDNLTYAEDRYFVTKSYYAANKIGMIDDIVYLYRGGNITSSTQRSDIGKIFDAIKVFNLLDDELKENNVQNKIRKISELKTILNNYYIIEKYVSNNIIYDSSKIIEFIKKNESIINLFNDNNKAILYSILLNENKIKLNNSKIKGISYKKTINLFSSRIKFKVSSSIGVLYKKFSKRNIILIGEKQGDSISDNSFALFKKMSKQKNVYFVTKKNNLEMSNKIGSTLKYGSFKHYFYFGMSSKYVFNDSMRDIYWHWNKEKNNKFKAKKIFIQHGVFGQSRACFYYDYFSMKGRNELPDIFCVSSKWEKNKIIGDFSFPEQNVRITGLARLDYLKKINYENNRDNGDKLILFVPTWRDWLKWKSRKEFANSEYILSIISISESLNLFCNEFNYRVNVVIHHAMSKFSLPKNLKNVTFNYMNNVDLQSLIIHSELLITDYSSIAFDFVYVEKPVFSIQFDKDKFLTLRGGEMICKKHSPFVNISYSTNELISNLYNFSNNKNKFDLSKIRRNFFSFYDSNNSERIINEINSI